MEKFPITQPEEKQVVEALPRDFTDEEKDLLYDAFNMKGLPEGDVVEIMQREIDEQPELVVKYNEALIAFQAEDDKGKKRELAKNIARMLG